MSLLCWCAGHLQQRNRSEPWIWFCHYEYCRGGWEGCGDVPSLCECIWWSYFSWQILGLVMVKIACLLMVATSHLIKFAHLCYAVCSLHINMLHVNINILVGHRGIGFSFLRHGGSNWYTTKFIRIENLWNVLTPCRTQKSLIKQVTKLALSHLSPVLLQLLSQLVLENIVVIVSSTGASIWNGPKNPSPAPLPCNGLEQRAKCS